MFSLCMGEVVLLTCRPLASVAIQALQHLAETTTLTLNADVVVFRHCAAPQQTAEN